MAQGVPGRLRPPDFLGVRHYKGGRSSALRTARLYPRRNPWYSFSEAESAPGRIVPSGATEKIPSGIDPGTSRLVPQCLNHYSTPGPVKKPLGLKGLIIHFWVNRLYFDYPEEVGAKLHRHMVTNF